MRPYCVVFSLLLIGACDSIDTEVPVHNQTSVEDDLRAIEALNQHDIDAVMNEDFDAVASQWTEDFVVISSSILRMADRGGPPPIDTAALLEPLEYVLDWEETVVTGDYAFAWGTTRSSSRAIESGEVFSSSGRILRIFQRQSDGSWKMYRTMVNSDPTAVQSDAGTPDSP
jgi:ketosteroid isomerase-like protein